VSGQLHGPAAFTPGKSSRILSSEINNELYFFILISCPAAVRTYFLGIHVNNISALFRQKISQQCKFHVQQPIIPLLKINWTLWSLTYIEDIFISVKESWRWVNLNENTFSIRDTCIYTQYLASHRGCPGLNQGLVMCDLWWTKWRWGRFSPSSSDSPANIYSINFCTITYHLGLVQ
jgi:hypothetical protein